MKPVLAVALVAGCYVGCLALAAVATLVTVGVTEHWGAARTGDAMTVLLGGVGLAYLLSVAVVFAGLTRLKAALWVRLAVTGVYGALLSGTFLLGAFLCAVLFNR